MLWLFIIIKNVIKNVDVKLFCCAHKSSINKAGCDFDFPTLKFINFWKYFEMAITTRNEHLSEKAANFLI